MARHYYRRFETMIAENNVIASPLARFGRFSHSEPLVHAIDNWIRDG